LRRLQVWRFSHCYFFAFGGYVALSVWLPHYLVAVYGLDLRMTGALAIAFSLPAGLLRILGGVITVYYPDQGGAVGAVGGLGGFVLPVTIGVANDLADVWTSCFMLLFALASISVFWMHFAIRRQGAFVAPARAIPLPAGRRRPATASAEPSPEPKGRVVAEVQHSERGHHLR
jgi:nitrate/nitrite transporter NarK